MCCRSANCSIDRDNPATDSPGLRRLRCGHDVGWAGGRGEREDYAGEPIAAAGAGAVTPSAKPGDDTKPTITVDTEPTVNPSRTEQLLEKSLGDLMMGALNDPLPPALGEVTLLLDDNSICDLWMVLTWSQQ